MATPIKETPVLRGRDAREFEARLRNPPKASSEERERVRAAFLSVKIVDKRKDAAGV